MCETAAYSCETALQFYLSFVHPRWDDYTSKITRLVSANKVLSKSEEANPMNIIETLEKLFPFAEFYSNAPQPLFQKKSFEEDYEVAKVKDRSYSERTSCVVLLFYFLLEQFFEASKSKVSFFSW